MLMKREEGQANAHSLRQILIAVVFRKNCKHALNHDQLAIL